MKPFDKLDRAICDGTENGFVKILTKKGTDKILGCTIVGPSAGDMIGEISAAMHNKIGKIKLILLFVIIKCKIGLAKIGKAVYPYPTYGESFRHLGDEYNRKKLTPKVKVLLRGIIKLRK